jgi:hypothetical protein
VVAELQRRAIGPGPSPRPPGEAIEPFLTKVGIVRFIFCLSLFIGGSALGYYLARPIPPASLSDADPADDFDYASARPIEAREAWRIYFETLHASRTFVPDPKPHPFFVAVAFALAGTLVLGVGAHAATVARDEALDVESSTVTNLKPGTAAP